MMKKYAYMIMVTQQNNNKFYEMIAEDGATTFKVRYGRVGATCVNTTYSINKWNQKYNEKIRKGYEDQTHLHLETDIDKKVFKEIQDKTVADLIKRLDMWANNVIHNNYNIGINNVSKMMVKKAEEALNEVAKQNSIVDFNNALLKLFKILPRKMSSVDCFLASSKNDFSEIITYETSLLDVMKGQVKKNVILEENKDVSNKTILEIMGLEIKQADSSDIKRIERHLNGRPKSSFKQAWVIKNTKTQQKFDEYLKLNNSPKVGLLWHGSKNENWLNILNAGLLLNPNASITGKMFGYGIYFAPSAEKSFGYTSARGSRWANGTDNTGFMALYAVVKEHPLDVYNFETKYYSFNENHLKKEDANAMYLHAHKGASLMNDEIIYYREDQMTIKYLVEFNI